jgi:flagellin
MAQTINTNLSSLTAQRNSTKTQNDLSTAISRLSSGLRINSAKDDAAGLAISERFTSQIRGLNQAARNANDGISLAQVAEGGLGSIGTNLQRIRELAVQSANATNSASDRAALQAEVSQLVAEVDRVGSQTEFNGTKLLDGTFSSQQFQVGANAGQTITVSGISSARTSALGASYTASSIGTATTGALAAGDLKINGNAIQASAAGVLPGQTAASAFSIAQAINASQGSVTAKANATGLLGAAPTSNTGVASGALKINGVDVGVTTAGTDAATQGVLNAAAINAVSAASGVTATVDSAGVLTLAAADGRDIAITGSAGALTDYGLTAATTHGTLSLSTNSNASGLADITVAGTTPAKAGLTAGTTASALTGTALSQVDISTVAGANTALASVDAALSSVNGERAKLGAIQNRFVSTIENLQTSSENLSASRSRIQDADFAAETAALARAQVLQQAGTAMIAQANQLPQQVLSLLKG